MPGTKRKAGAKRSKKPGPGAGPFRVEFDGLVNGRVRKVTATVLDGEDRVRFSHKVDMVDAEVRESLARLMARDLGLDEAVLAKKINDAWNAKLTEVEAGKRAAEEAARREEE